MKQNEKKNNQIHIETFHFVVKHLDSFQVLCSGGYNRFLVSGKEKEGEREIEANIFSTASLRMK